MNALLSFESQGFAALQGRFNARDALKGLQLMTSEGQQGVGQGVDPHGHLQLQSNQGKILLNSSEVSIRPIAATP
jgi:BirA family biotin operon repressor/biotin-[acetyl-CoA-carboxylase] ligase